MSTYRVDSKTSKLIVTARSSVHDTEILWQGITGNINAETGDNAKQMQASIEVDMTTADAGDWLKNRKMRKDMQFDKHPKASFVLDSVDALSQEGEHMTATLTGTLSWRGKSMPVTVTGDGDLGTKKLVAKGSFDIDMTKLGITPPKILMIKVQDVVNCQIEIHAVA